MNHVEFIMHGFIASYDHTMSFHYFSQSFFLFFLTVNKLIQFIEESSLQMIDEIGAGTFPHQDLEPTFLATPTRP
jgi:hypothetical protein